MKTITRPLMLKVPPLAAMLLAGIAAWFVAKTWSTPHFDSVYLPVISTAFGLLGVGCSLLGVISFRSARTTVNPLNPSAATTLVMSGVYRFTRNPMYLGFLLTLVAEIIWLGNPCALAVAPAFVIYLNHFQIAPEECALRDLFGVEFNTYTARVPRWL